MKGETYLRRRSRIGTVNSAWMECCGTRKGGKIVTIPLAPRTARAIDLTTGERCDGPIFLTADGRRLDRHGAGPGWRRWLCEQHPNGYSVAPTNRRGVLEFGRAVGPHARVVCDAQQDPGMVRKLQLAIFENLLYFLEIYC